MGEDITKEDYSTFAVKIQGIKADWIINEHIGFQFLLELSKKKNKEVFESKYVKIVIQFLYESYSKNIMKLLLPPFLFHLLFVNMQLFLNEDKRARERLMKNISKDDPEYAKLNQDRLLYLLFDHITVGFCTLFNFLNIFVFVR